MIKNCFFLFVALAVGLNAQKLSEQECINKALKFHPDIKKFILQIDQSKYHKNEIKSANLPQISLNGEYDFSKTFTSIKNGIFNTEQDNAWQMGVSLNQKIWDFSKTTNLIEAAKKSEDIAKLSLKDAKAFLSYLVKLQYEQMIVQKKAIKVREEDLKSKYAFYQQSISLVKQGLKTKADESRFLWACSNAKDNLNIAKANFEKAKDSLSLYIGENIGKNVKLDNSALKNSLPIKQSLLLKKIMNDSPQILSLKRNIEKNNFLYNAAKDSKYGSISAIASYTRQNTLNKYNSSVVGVGINIPLYTGNKIKSLTQQALIEKEIARKELASKKLALKQEFEQLMIDLKRYNFTIKAKKDQIKSADDTKKLIEARYKEGLSTYLEVLDSNSLYLNAKLGLIEAYYAKSSIIDKMKYLEGKIK